MGERALVDERGTLLDRLQGGGLAAFMGAVGCYADGGAVNRLKAGEDGGLVSETLLAKSFNVGSAAGSGAAPASHNAAWCAQPRKSLRREAERYRVMGKQ